MPLVVLTTFAFVVLPINFNYNNVEISNYSTVVAAPIGGGMVDDGLGGAPEVSPIEVLITVIEWLRNIVILLAVLFIILGALAFITAGGDDGKIAKGRNAILYALIAVMIVALAQGLVVWMRDTAEGM